MDTHSLRSLCSLLFQSAYVFSTSLESRLSLVVIYNIYFPILIACCPISICVLYLQDGIPRMAYKGVVVFRFQGRIFYLEKTLSGNFESNRQDTPTGPIPCGLNSVTMPEFSFCYGLFH